MRPAVHDAVLPISQAQARRAATVRIEPGRIGMIVPVTPDNWSMCGLRDLTISLNGARRANPRLRVAGVLLTKKDASAVARDTERALRESGWPVLNATIRASSHPSRCSFSHQSLREAARWSGIAADYRELCDEYMEGFYHGENQ